MNDFEYLWDAQEKPYDKLWHSPIAIDDPITHTWGGEASVWKFEAVKDGEVTATRILGSRGPMKLDVTASSNVLTEADTWDMAAVRIRITDSCGNTCPYVQLPVRLKLTGEAELIGPDIVTAEGGMCGTYIRTKGISGKAELTVKCDGLEDVILTFEINNKRTERC